jgi:hypothetical protein
MILNQAKVAWKWAVSDALVKCSSLELAGPFRFTYTTYPSSNRSFDTSNVCSVIDKFTCDALIEFGVIPDDSYKIIPIIVYQFGNVDKQNPRVELEIISLNKTIEACKIAEDIGL